MYGEKSKIANMSLGITLVNKALSVWYKIDES